MNYVIGGGISGLIEAYYNNAFCIDTNFLGQLNTRFCPGPRIFKHNEKVVNFIIKIYKELGERVVIDTQLLKIGYEDELGNISNIASDDFKRKYSLITRGKEQYEPSFLSSGENKILAIQLFDLDVYDSYNLVFIRLLKLLERRGAIMTEKVVNIDYLQNQFTTDKNTYRYDNLISTINLNILLKILKMTEEDLEMPKLELEKKNFYKLPKQESEYAYVYCINGIYTRRTFFPQYTVVETNGNVIQHDVLDKYEGLPLQIKNSLNFTSIQGIQLSGRYAEWNHSVKANQIIERYEH